MASHYGHCDNEKVTEWLEPRTELMKRCIHVERELAFVETVRGGLIPCRVIATRVNGLADVTVEYTVTRDAYRRGEHDTVSATRVVPRRHVYVKNGMFRIGGTPWHWGAKPEMIEFKPGEFKTV